jgi:glutamate/aspartate transport system substrate-binding protein
MLFVLKPTRRASPVHSAIAATVLGILLGSAGAQTAPAASVPTLTRIRASGVITLAHRESSVPFSYLDDRGRPVGYAMELCLRVVEAVRRQLKLPDLRVAYLPVSAAERLPAIIAGKADLECGNTTNTAERRKSVAFSVTHYFAGGRLLVRTGSNIRRLSDLRGQTVVTTRGSTHAKVVQSQLDRGILAKVRLLEVKDATEALAALQGGQAQAFLFDDIVLYSLRAGHATPDAFEVVGEFTSVEPLAVMLRKNDPEFKKLVDVTLSHVMVDGDIRAIFRRWFESPIPPKGVNLRVPMNVLMRDQVQFPTDKVGDEIGG